MEATLAWLPHGADAQHAPAGQAETARTALAKWATLRGLRLDLPSSNPTARLPVDLTISDRVEAALARAHDAITAEDADAADRTLADAEALLRAHPEAPNAAWQMAEVHRAWAARWARLAPRDDDRAKLQWQAAAALDGGRAAGVGERAAPRVAEVNATLALEGEGEATLDGRSVATTGSVHVAPGEHQLVVRRKGDVVWADWVALSASATVRVAVPGAEPCSAEDLAHAVSFDGGFAATGVRCTSWVAASPGSQPGRYVVAVCDRDACSTPFEWRSGPDPSLADAAAAEPRGHPFPTWAKWTIVGAGAAAAAIAATLAVTDAFHPHTASGGFVSGGLQITRAGYGPGLRIIPSVESPGR